VSRILPQPNPGKHLEAILKTIGSDTTEILIARLKKNDLDVKAFCKVSVMQGAVGRGNVYWVQQDVEDDTKGHFVAQKIFHSDVKCPPDKIASIEVSNGRYLLSRIIGPDKTEIDANNPSPDHASVVSKLQLAVA
jgi:hypothetical protein